MVENGQDRLNDWAANHRKRHLEIIDLLKLNGGETVLDVGIEPYIFTELLLKQTSDIDVAGIAYGDVGNERTEEVSGHDIRVRECNVETDKWPYEDSEFDRVVMGAIIEHLFDPLAALKQARRVLTDEGRLVLSTPNAIRLIKRVNTALGINPYDGYPRDSVYNRHNHEWTIDELRDILPVAGFEMAGVSTQVHPRTGLQKAIELTTRPFTRFHDQFIIAAEKGETVERTPKVYRSGITEVESG